MYGDFHVKDKIFNMGITIPGKTVFLIETAPCLSDVYLRKSIWNCRLENGGHFVQASIW